MPGGSVQGAEIGRGLRSVVYEYGVGEVVKVPNADVPATWLDVELRLTRSVERAGARVPRGLRLVEMANAAALAGERIGGPSMWDRLIADPGCAEQLADELARIQVELAELPSSFELPAQRDRVASKVHLAARRYGDDLLEALDLMPPDAGPMLVCHGDLHPRNVLLTADGPVIIDWFDASRGSLAAEIARTVVVLEHVDEMVDASGLEYADAMTAFTEFYIVAVCRRSGLSFDEVEGWRVVQGIARLAEGFGLRGLGRLRTRLREAHRAPAAR